MDSNLACDCFLFSPGHFNFFELSPLKCNINNVWRTVISANCVFFNSYLFWLFKLSILILGEGDLHDLVRKTMYAGVINNLFGDNTLPVDDPKVNPKSSHGGP